MITLAVGDVHGCYDKLINLLEQGASVAADQTHRYIFLGDYIDRGADSQAVVTRLMELDASGAGHIFLRGNHEEMLLQAFLDPFIEAEWLKQGGDRTLASYGAATVHDLPTVHVNWLFERPLSYDDGLRLFVHAGINPTRALDEQSTTDLLWIREPFLSFDGPLERLIIHGHSPTNNRRPDLRPNRVNIDTGAVFGGPLSAAVFVDGLLAPTAFFHSYA